MDVAGVAGPLGWAESRSVDSSTCTQDSAPSSGEEGAPLRRYGANLRACLATKKRGFELQCISAGGATPWWRVFMPPAGRKTKGEVLKRIVGVKQAVHLVYVVLLLVLVHRRDQGRAGGGG